MFVIYMFYFSKPVSIITLIFFFPEILDPEVTITCLTIISPDRDDIVLPIPENGTPKGLWFTLKEGCHYRLKFTFHVSNNIVSGLKYTNTVWKTAVKGKFFFFCLIYFKLNL